GLALGVGDLVEGKDLGRVDDGGIEPVLEGLVEEDRVEHLAGRGIEPEADIGYAEDGRHTGQLDLDAPDGLERLHGVATKILLARADGKGQGVEDEVLGPQPV